MLNKRNRVIAKVITYVLLILFSIYTMFPFVWMLISSFKPKTEIRTATPSFTIDAPTLENFHRVLFDAGFVNYIKNSLIVSVTACVISMIIAVLAGYALSRFYKLKVVKVSNLAMMLSQMIPGVLLLVPLYMIMQMLGILESYRSLILAYTTFVIPLCTFMMSSFFDTVPTALEEAAEIDGCNRAQTLTKVIIPLSIPSLVSTGLYAFINAWNEFMYGYIFISTDTYRTLTPAIMLFKGANTIDWGALMAGSVVAVIPVTFIFLFLQRYFLAGLMAGSVKG
ncbi:carbohydrate ABC transporter permease [Mordavella massiliensis]|uniref:Carbohydrate ABC transporter permease n=1 Tax=Mordavella massiliensis TaxID=1871024 RepID=A0A938XBR4_9CLOT|nr:carbohydrate ABC transporter permease [Mordavella massiliensis]MBM6947794.1 carbohydrate ABC transporter permease [Mordavella massiliensis]